MSVSYKIRLSNGQGYNLIGCKESEPLLDKLAVITRLKQGRLSNAPNLVCRIGDGRFPGPGWRSHNFFSAKIWLHATKSDVICEFKSSKSKDSDIEKIWRMLYGLYRQVDRSGGFLLHSALVEYRDKGILLAGSGDTGKSTCCRRLPSTWRTRCDDEALVVCDKEKQYFAHPMPTWSDYLWGSSKKTWDIQSFIAPGAICFLGQAKRDSISLLKEEQAAGLIYESAIQAFQKYRCGLGPKEQREAKIMTFHNACEFTKRIPAYILKVSLKGRFWKLLEEALNES